MPFKSLHAALELIAARIVAPDGGFQRRLQESISGLTIFELETHARRDGLGLVDRVGFRGLRQVDQFLVVAEVAREELRVAVDSQTLDHQALEMAQQKVRQIESPKLRLGERREHRSGREEL